MTPLDAAKLIGGPGSIGFLAFGTAIGFLIIRLVPRYLTVGRLWLLALYSSYLIMAVPFVALALIDPLNALPASPCNPQRVDTLIVFDGDNRIGRAEEANRLWSLVRPATVLVSGEEWLLKPLLAGGIPSAHIVRDDSAANTREQVRFVGEYLKAHTGFEVAVIASRLQMPRVIALAKKLHVRATFCASPVDREPATRGAWLFVPAYSALRVSRDGLYERAALAYYGWRDWTAADEPSAVVSAQ